MPTLDDLLARANLMGPPAPCPPPPPPTVCGHGSITIRMDVVAPNAVTTVTVGCGERLLGQVIERCAMVEAFNERDGLTSATVERSYPVKDCLPLPEPSIAAGLGLGLIALAAMSRRRLGRRT